MQTILANTELSFKGIERLEQAGYKVINQHFVGKDLIHFINKESISKIYISESDLTDDLLNGCKDLKIIGCSGEIENRSILQKTYSHIQFLDLSKVFSQAIAELVFGHLLGMTRFLYDSNRQMPLEGEVNFDGMHQVYSQGSVIKGKTLGIIGLDHGAIATIKMAIALGLNVLVFDKDVVKKTISLELPNDQTFDIEIDTKSLEEVCMKSDFISTHISNKIGGFIGKEEFELMKMGVCLINTSGEGVIDEVELIQAIDSGIVKHAALDCFDNQPKPDMRILMNPNISLSPSIAKLTKETSIKIGEAFANKLVNLG